MRQALLAAALAFGLAGPTLAAAPERLSDPGQEAHAHALFRQIRCLVCQNESIDDSDAPLAADLRALVRGDVATGRSDASIRTALVDRYGEFVLLKPRLSGGNAALWLMPFAIVAAGLAAFGLRARGPRPPLEPALTDVERARVSVLAATVTVPPRPRPTDTTPAV